MDVTQGCPGSQMLNFKEKEDSSAGEDVGKIESQLRQWPIQLHLVSPSAPYYQGSDVLLTADCVAYALGDFHRQFLKGKSLAIACPKLDEGQEIYQEKIKSGLPSPFFQLYPIISLMPPQVVFYLVPTSEQLMGLY